MPLDDHLSQPSQPPFEWRFICFWGSTFAWKTWSFWSLSVISSGIALYLLWLAPLPIWDVNADFMVPLQLLQTVFIGLLIVVPVLILAFIGWSKFRYGHPLIPASVWVHKIITALGVVYYLAISLWECGVFMYYYLDAVQDMHQFNIGILVSMLVLILVFAFIFIVHASIISLLELDRNFMHYSVS